jgi:hypothetical protein
MHINGIPHGRPVGMHTGPKPQRPQDVAQFAIVSAVLRRIEPDQRRVSFLVDVEPRDQVVWLDSIRRRQRRDE